ncbi:kinase-like protein [Marasmius fiardii PR-910]|nr:kinase-like protein [Marasmius fiardii PR-910]
MILRLEEEPALHRSGRVQMQDSKTENVLPESAEEDIPLSPPPPLMWLGHDNKRSIRDRLRLGSELDESLVNALSQGPWLGLALANEQIGYDERPSRSRFKAILRLRAIITRGWKSDLTTITPIIPRIGTCSNLWAQIVANHSSAVKASVLASGAIDDVRLDTTSPMLTSAGGIGPGSSALTPHEEGIDVDLEILNDMRRLVEGVMEDEQQLKELLEAKGEDAQLLLDALQVLAKLSDVATNLRSLMLKMMLQLSKRSGLCPQCLMIENVERLGDRPVAHGGFGDVWKGKIGQQIVCLKTVKVYEFSDISKLLKEYMREAIVWQQLKHPNLLPFLGMCYLDKAQTQLCLVSPWMERGNLVRFLENTPRADVDHYSLVYDVASGLSYLHDEDIVHGDLKGLNVLITPDERACITDFGLSRVQGTHKFGLTSTKIDKGTTRYSSPELLTGSNSSLSSDIYAFGCVCYEIFEGKAPFQELKLDASVIVTVLIHKKHPSRPELTSLNDTMWEIMVDCWAVEPWKRPEASDVLTRVANLECLVGEEEGGGSIKPAPSGDVYLLSVIGKNVKRPRLDVAALTQLQKNLGCLSQV